MITRSKTDTGGGPGMSRRDLLQRGAGVGAALWVVPAVQLLSMKPAAAQTTSPGDTPLAQFPSHIELLVRPDGDPTVYGVKFDEADGWENLWDRIPDARQMCAVKNNATYSTSDAVVADFGALVTVERVVLADGRGAYRVDVPDTYTFVSGWAKDGHDCIPPSLVPGTTDTYQFSA